MTMAPKRSPESLDPRMSVEGAIVDSEGKLVRGEYKALQDLFQDEPNVQKRPLRLRGVEDGEQVPDGLKAWEDPKGAGWIAKHPARAQNVWYSYRAWGSWKFAFRLAVLQLSIWAKSGTSPGSRASPAANVPESSRGRGAGRLGGTSSGSRESPAANLSESSRGSGAGRLGGTSSGSPESLATTVPERSRGSLAGDTLEQRTKRIRLVGKTAAALQPGLSGDPGAADASAAAVQVRRRSGRLAQKLGPPQTRRRLAAEAAEVAAAADAVARRPTRHTRRVSVADRQTTNRRTSLPDSLRAFPPQRRKNKLLRRHCWVGVATAGTCTRRASTAAQRLLRLSFGLNADECGKLVERISAATVADSTPVANFEASTLASFARTMGMPREERDLRLRVVSSTVAIQRAIQAAFLSPEACRRVVPESACYRGGGSVARDFSPEKLPASANPLRPVEDDAPESCRGGWTEPAAILRTTSTSCRTTRLFQELSASSSKVLVSLTDLPASLLDGLLQHLTLVEAFRASGLCRILSDVCSRQAAERLQDLDICQFGVPIQETSSMPRSGRCRQFFGWQGREAHLQAFVQCLRESSLLQHFRRLDIRGLPPKLLFDKAFIAALGKIPKLSSLVISECDWETREDFKAWLKRVQLSETVKLETEV